jgi:hypothetical protein
MTCFMLLVMGLGPKSFLFLLLGLPFVCFALLNVVFCLDFGFLFFFSLVPLPGVFRLFIYHSCKNAYMFG